ncbi:MAG: sigma-70 family RNA polymerase sigma factor [Pararhodobacter sp.]
MRAANRGDQRAYARLLVSITPVVRGIVRARGGALGVDQCEDVVQEVLLAIHTKRQTWREDAPLRPWLYAVTRHKVIDAFRARGKRIDLPLDEMADVLPAPEGADPFEARDMARVIDQLDPRAAAIVRAIGIDGESTAETGARLGMSEGAVRVALHRALKSLARLRERMIE